MWDAMAVTGVLFIITALIILPASWRERDPIQQASMLTGGFSAILLLWVFYGIWIAASWIFGKLIGII